MYYNLLQQIDLNYGRPMTVEQLKPTTLVEQVYAGSISFAKSPKIFQIKGLGSCIGICFYSSQEKFGALAHIMLPSSEHARTPNIKGKYVDTAVPELLNIFRLHHIDTKNIIVKLVGGSHMFPPLKQTIFDVATKNFFAVKESLAQYHLSIYSQDIGGNYGRSMKFFMENGEIHVSQIGSKLVSII